jgi:hypothetical protein
VSRNQCRLTKKGKQVLTELLNLVYGEGEWLISRVADDADIHRETFAKIWRAEKYAWESNIEKLFNLSDEIDENERHKYLFSNEYLEYKSSSRDISQIQSVSPSLLQASKELQPLIDILAPVDLRTINKAYSCSQLEGRPRRISETIEAMVQQLAEIPGIENRTKPLLQFIGLLISDQDLDSDRKGKLQKWFESQGLSPIPDSNELRPETVETYLMVKVQPRFLNDPSLGFLVSAAIARDPNPLEPKVKLISTSIGVPEGLDPKYAPGYSKEDLPDILSQVITDCGAKHSLTDLTVQCFLPIELMSLPIEHWQIKFGRQQQAYYHQRLKAVMVRSYDRHFLPIYRGTLGDCGKYWNRLSASQHTNCRDSLFFLEPATEKNKMNWDSSAVVGCRFIEHEDPQAQADFWDYLLCEGIPIAIWKRQPHTNQETAETEIQSVTNCNLAGLSASVKNYRLQAQAGISENATTDHLRATSISLLWDNPYRPFPTTDYSSA